MSRGLAIESLQQHPVGHFSHEVKKKQTKEKCLYPSSVPSYPKILSGMELRTGNCISPHYFVIIIDRENHLLGPANCSVGLYSVHHNLKQCHLKSTVPLEIYSPNKLCQFPSYSKTELLPYIETGVHWLPVVERKLHT